MKRLQEQPVLDVHHWNENLFSFKVARPENFTFRTGEFTMIGIEVDEYKILRAYSIASPCDSNTLEFFSIIVPDGELTPELCKIQPGDNVLINTKTTGSLVMDNLEDGRTLFLLATGTGLAPFLGTIQDFETYEKFEHVVLVHTVREDSELAYYDFIRELTDKVGQSTGYYNLSDRTKDISEFTNGYLHYVPTVTRDDSERAVCNRRCSDLFKENQINFYIEEENIPDFDPNRDSVMICGSTAMNKEMIEYLKGLNTTHGTESKPGRFVYEKAFVG